MIVNFEDITDQQCADIIAHFVKRKGVNEIIIHTKSDDIVITKKPKHSEDEDMSGFAATAACALITTI